MTTINVLSSNWPLTENADSNELASEPTAASLPATINPLQFLVENVWRNNATLVRIDVTHLPGGLGLRQGAILRRITPPWKLLVILFELSVDAETVTLSEQASEDVTYFDGATPVTEVVDLSDHVGERVVAQQIQGVCQ